MFRLFSLLIGFAFGHIQTSYILGKTVKKIDIREHGSGNPGMTNSLRVMGAKIGVAVLLMDVFKAFAAYYVCSALFGGSGAFFNFCDGAVNVLPGVYGAVGAILGHMFPVYMRFRGGKSIACGIGLILALDIRVAGVILTAALLLVLFTRYISVASIISLILLPIVFAMFGYGWELILIGVFAAALLTYRHKANISRLINGTENKIGQKVKPPGIS